MRGFLAIALSGLLFGCATGLPRYQGDFKVRTEADRPLMLGQVKVATSVEPGTSLLKALEKARWITSASTEKNAILTCPGEAPTRINLHALVRGDMSQNAVLAGGCIFYVPKTARAEMSTWIGVFRGTGDVYYILSSDK